MFFSKKWIMLITIALALGIESFVTNAAIATSVSKVKAVGTASTIAIEPLPILIAKSSKRKIKKSSKRPNRRVKSKQSKVVPTNQSVIDTGSQLELDGRDASYGCIINEIQRDCNRFVEIKNSLMSLSLQNPGQGYSLYYGNLSSYEAYLHGSKGMGDAAK
jgi:hypothetical protein